MWKATATLDKNIGKKSINDDDDWDSDPNFSNDVSERDQRWGKQKTIDSSKPLEFEGDMEGKAYLNQA
jgi:cortactin